MWLDEVNGSVYSGALYIFIFGPTFWIWFSQAIPHVHILSYAVNHQQLVQTYLSGTFWAQSTPTRGTVGSITLKICWTIVNFNIAFRRCAFVRLHLTTRNFPVTMPNTLKNTSIALYDIYEVHQEWLSSDLLK